MRVAIFRAQADVERTAERLRQLGHAPLAAPVIEIRPTRPVLPAGPFAAVMFASAHAIEALSSEHLLALRSTPAFCVGARTAGRALEANLSPVGTAADATSLVRLIRAELPRPVQLLFIAGRDRKPTLEDGVRGVGHEVTVAESYEARAVSAWSDGICADWQLAPVDAALHFSRRSADLAFRCAGASGLGAGFQSALHCCLSDDVASALSSNGIKRLVVAQRPTESSLLACLDGDGSRQPTPRP